MYIEITDFKKFYDNQLVFEKVNISMEKGEIITLLGDSGSGKSTLLRLLAGLDKDYNGHFYLDGVKMDNIPKGKRPISMMFQDAVLFPHMSVIENLIFPLKCKGIKKKERYEKSQELLKVMGLSALIKRYPCELSGGQRQRVALAAAIIPSPKLILLDEPFNGLDLKLTRELRGWMKDILSENNINAIFVTHFEEDALTMSKRLFIVKDNTIKEDLTNVKDEFFGEGIYIDGKFEPLENLEINNISGIPVKIENKIKIHGVDFFIIQLPNKKEMIIKAQNDILGTNVFLDKV